jgi:hypothetical protein
VRVIAYQSDVRAFDVTGALPGCGAAGHPQALAKAGKRFVKLAGLPLRNAALSPSYRSAAAAPRRCNDG